MLKRKLYDDLIDWKKNRSKDKALLLMGARQVGKSTLAREFGKNNFKRSSKSIFWKHRWRRSFSRMPIQFRFFHQSPPGVKNQLSPAKR